MTSIDEYIKEEEHFICNGILQYLEDNVQLKTSSDDVINEHITDKNIVELLHGQYIYNSIYTYLCYKNNKLSKSVIRLFGDKTFKAPIKNNTIQPDQLPFLCEQSHINFLNSQYIYKEGKITKKNSKKNLIDKGAVYTQAAITHSIVDNSLSAALNGKKDLNSIKILDFATGTGRFYTEIVSILSDKYGLDTEYIVLNCVYAIDTDPTALNITKLKAVSFLHNFTEGNIKTICDKIALKNGLLWDPLSLMDTNAITHKDFDGLFFQGFDVIVSNPPYLVLKPNKKIKPSAWEYLEKQIQYFKKSGIYTYSIEGMLNLYQLSIESMLAMLKNDGEMGIICPSTLFADLSATKLRKHLLLKNQIRSIRYYAEKDDLFVNVTQATCVFHLKKGIKTETISINDGKRTFDVPCNLISELFPDNMEIPNISSLEWGILRKLMAQPKLKNCKEIRNKRGELDLSILRNYITSTPTKYRLVRGNMISELGITSDNGEYVISDFINAKSKDYIQHDFGRRRLICQQISNTATARRLNFCYCEPNDILGNSCNYISGTEDNLKKLYILLNSPLLNWRFKITSSNNHINNYELDELPIVNLDKVNSDTKFKTRIELSDYVCELYGLNKSESKFIREYENI